MIKVENESCGCGEPEKSSTEVVLRLSEAGVHFRLAAPRSLVDSAERRGLQGVKTTSNASGWSELDRGWLIPELCSWGREFTFPGSLNVVGAEMRQPAVHRGGVK